MKQIIIIMSPSNKTDLQNVIKDATDNQPIPSDVLQISDTAFLIDIHKSLPFFSGLVHNAHIRHVPCSVFAVEDTLLLPKGLKIPGQDQEK
ncbi:hypothetical protein KKG19_05345 [Patescibacteria group bacterium]|nr:hypothetical protein [Patescibacteria group bacterium]